MTLITNGLTATYSSLAVLKTGILRKGKQHVAYYREMLDPKLVKAEDVMLPI